MRFSRLGIFAVLLISVFLTTNCSQYNRIMSRKNLVDGSLAYKERKFEVAEDLFRKASQRDPEGATIEGKTAQLFLARTIHSRFIGNRIDKNLAEEAIKEYKKSLVVDKNDQSSYKAIASLYENLQKPDEWQQWVTERSNDTGIKSEYRAEALTSLAAKQNTCANEVTDTAATKKTIKKDGKDIFQFTKPASTEDFENLKNCITKGLTLIDQAVALEPENVKNAGALNVKSLTDEQLKSNLEAVKPFESARSYRASLIIQASRLAEMEGRDADRDRLKTDADKARAEFVALSEVDKNLQAEIEARVAVKEEEANTDKGNANAVKKK